MKFISNLFEYVLSFIFPKEADVSLIENMTEEEIIEAIPLSNRTENDKYKALFQYQNKIARKAIWEIKYNDNRKITEKFSKLLYEYILEEMSDEFAFGNFNTPIIVPIPKGKASLKERGFNQCELIVKEIMKFDKEKNFSYSFEALKKIKNTPHQSKQKNRANRLKNLTGCFWADENIVKDKCIILIDDVITTGATMNEASKTLHSAGAKKVVGFAIAH